MKPFITGVFVLLLVSLTQAQPISGLVLGLEPDGESAPVPFANVYLPQSMGGTTTSEDGKFILQPTANDSVFIVSALGFSSDTFRLQKGKDYYPIIIRRKVSEEVTVTKKRFGHSMISMNSRETLSLEDLGKMACCNLSESFENSSTVSVHFSDAVTGAKHIKMLGLDGRYTQILFEQLPSIRGLKNAYGLTHVPGPWMKSISVNRGAGSVTNGYDGITGQINYEYRKPMDEERFSLNLFGTRHGQFESNVVINQPVGRIASTGVLFHASGMRTRHDANSDGFQDLPQFRRFQGLNRWYIIPNEKFSSQFGVGFSYDERQAGQLDGLDIGEQVDRRFIADVVDRSISAFGKTGFRFDTLNRSLGIQYRYQHNEIDGWYPRTHYRAREDFAKINAIFMTDFPKEGHQLKAGGSMLFNRLDEEAFNETFSFDEWVPGLFGEYTFTPNEDFSLVSGMRFDYSNRFGFYASPRIHMRYNPGKDWVLRLAGGRGYRTPFNLAENLRLFVSSRTLVVDEDLGNESAWNWGANAIKEWKWNFVPLSLSVDFYGTYFDRKVVADYESPRIVHFYNLDGRAFSHSLQVRWMVEPVKGLDLSLDYKLDDVRTTFAAKGLLRDPFVPLHSGLLHVSYETPNEQWVVSTTGKLNGRSRLPSTEGNPEAYQRADSSPIWFALNAQVKYRKPKWEVYVGGENLTGFWQENPIVASSEPFSPFFDASMIWGPLGGPRVYAGLNVNLFHGE